MADIVLLLYIVRGRRRNCNRLLPWTILVNATAAATGSASGGVIVEY